MNLIILFLGLAVLMFGFVVIFGAPYLPTLKLQTEAALSLLNLQPGQTLIELGCGDGRVLKAAAKQGLSVIGYELNPLLIIVAYINTWKYRKEVRIIWGNYWSIKWPVTDGIFVFLLPKFMTRLDNKIIQEYHRPVKLVSFAFRIKGKNPTATKSGVYLYMYP